MDSDGQSKINQGAQSMQGGRIIQQLLIDQDAALSKA